jgi:nucleotide-binding universal stress UspA family protein
MRVKTLLFPVDFSTRSRLAAPYVRAMAQRFEAELLAAHVVDPVQHMAQFLGSVDPEDLEARWLVQGRARLEEFAHQELRDCRATLIVEPGEAAQSLVSLARVRDVDWIMMPTHGFAGLRRFVLGSVTARVLHDAICPVWTAAIHEDGQDAARAEPRQILCAVDLDGGQAERTLVFAGALAHRFGASLRVLHATPALANSNTNWLDGDVNDQVAQRAYDALGAMLAAHQIQAELAVHAGEAARVIRAVALESAADLVVIARGAAAEGMGRLRAHSYGIINEAPCPVLSV